MVFVPRMTIVGLPDAAVQESRERVASAIKNAGLHFPRKPLVVNLAPATVRKEGPAYDLPIALGILVTTGQLPPDCGEGSLVVGELSLDGSVRHVRGVLPMAAGAPLSVPLLQAVAGGAVLCGSAPPVVCPQDLRTKCRYSAAAGTKRRTAACRRARFPQLNCAAQASASLAGLAGPPSRTAFAAGAPPFFKKCSSNREATHPGCRAPKASHA